MLEDWLYDLRWLQTHARLLAKSRHFHQVFKASSSAAFALSEVGWWGDATPKISLSCKSSKSRRHGRPPWWSRLGWRGGLFETVVRCNLLSIYVCLSLSFWPSLTRSPCSCCFAFFPPFSSRNSNRTRALALASNQPACARPADEGVSIATCWWGPKILRSDDAPDFSKSAIFFTNKIADGADVFLEACFHFS